MYELQGRVLGNYIVICVLFGLYLFYKLAFYYTKSVDEAKLISWGLVNFISVCFFGYSMSKNIFPYLSLINGLIMILSIGILSGLVLIFMKASDHDSLVDNNTKG